MGDGATAPGDVLRHTMAVAQGSRYAGGAGRHRVPAVVCPQTGDIIHVSPMGRDQVIAIQAVFGQELPVGLYRVHIGTGNYLHPCLGLIHDQVKVVSGSCQVGEQVFDSGVETHEVKTPVAVDPRWFLQAQLAPVEGRAVGVFPGEADQLPGGVERPGVIEASQDFGVPLVAAAEQRTPVGAGIEEYPDLTVFPTDKEKRAARYRAAPVVSGVFHFRLVSQIDPAAVEDACLFPPEQIHGGHGRPVDPENSSLTVIDNQVFDLHTFPRISGGSHTDRRMT